MGDASALAESVQRSMDAKSSPPSALTRSEAFLSCLLWSLAEVCFLMLLMLVTGAMYYKFFTDRETWGEGVFYAITTIATIGYIHPHIFIYTKLYLHAYKLHSYCIYYTHMYKYNIHIHIYMLIYRIYMHA